MGRGRPKGSKDSKQRKRRDINPRGGSRFEVRDEMKAYNANTIAFLNAVTPETKGSKYNLPELQKRFKNYLVACEMYGVRPSNMNAYRALGLHKTNVFEWINGVRDCPQDTRDFLIDVSEYCSSYRENLGIDGKIHPATLIFWQRNFDGLKDQHEQVIINRSTVEETASEEELAKKYLESASITALPDNPNSESVLGRNTEDELVKEKNK
ncbi:MAG: hypothetical protein J6S85_13660 [Methanobrevibacter sp.]|nr:hypothetical protein [Methanobrevibacter sp.]